MNVVFVHGRGQSGKDPEASRQDWLQGMRQGFTAARRQPTALGDAFYPFYGDLLQDFVNNLPTKRPTSRGDTPTLVPDEFEKQFVERLAFLAGVDPAEATMEDPVLAKGAGTWGWVHGLLRAVQRKVPWLAEAAIGEEVEDVKVYLGNGYIQQKVNDLVLKDLKKGACVVVSHSLGTVVAYNILATHPELDVPLFLTAGSPLGIGVITNALPPPVIPAKRWLNVSDKHDIVALFPTLDTHTFIDGIENITDIDNGDEPHSISRYLSDARVGVALADALAEPL